MVLLYDQYELLEEKAELLKTMGHPIRLSIVELLCDIKELTVTEIHSKLKIEQAVASHHLRIMKSAGVVDSNKSGKNVFYSLSEQNIKKIFLALFNK